MHHCLIEKLTVSKGIADGRYLCPDSGRVRITDRIRLRIIFPSIRHLPAIIEVTASETDFPSNFHLRFSQNAARWRQRTARRAAAIATRVSPRAFKRTYLAAGDASSGSCVVSGHADGASAGGPRRPLIRSQMLAKTRRASAASAICKTCIAGRLDQPRAGLDQTFPQRGERPPFDSLECDQRSQAVGEIVGQGVKLEARSVPGGRLSVASVVIRSKQQRYI
jgi:hypothetical protein